MLRFFVCLHDLTVVHKKFSVSGGLNDAFAWRAIVDTIRTKLVESPATSIAAGCSMLHSGIKKLLATSDLLELLAKVADER